MSFQAPVYQQQVLYKADSNALHTLKSIRHHLQHICRHHVNQVVRIETMDGQVYMGRIIGCNGGMLYLGVRNQGMQRDPYDYEARPFSSDEMILTLVLYELLVITLLYT